MVLFQWFAVKNVRMVIRPKYKREDLTDYNIHIGQTNIKRVGNDCQGKHLKFLGLLIDEKLIWSGHLSLVNQKIAR